MKTLSYRGLIIEGEKGVWMNLKGGGGGVLNTGEWSDTVSKMSHHMKKGVEWEENWTREI